MNTELDNLIVVKPSLNLFDSLLNKKLCKVKSEEYHTFGKNIFFLYVLIRILNSLLFGTLFVFF